MPYYDKILEKYKNLPEGQKIVKLFEIVRDIPYGDVQPRSPENCWKQKKGPCSTKNIVLYDLYKALGVPVQKWMCSFQYNQSRKFSNEMNYLLKKPVVVLHTFIKIKRNNKWVVVDATHDLGLEKAGIQVQKNWDGFSDTLLAVKPIKFFRVRDTEEKKAEFYSNESKEDRERRKKFMALFFKWVDSLRK